MTYRSESRGLLYTAPPTGDDVDRPDGSPTGETTEAETEDQTNDGTATTDAPETANPELETTTSTTDANWTGTVPADD
jgi:hypothetical protein